MLHYHLLGIAVNRTLSKLLKWSIVADMERQKPRDCVILWVADWHYITNWPVSFEPIKIKYFADSNNNRLYKYTTSTLYNKVLQQSNHILLHSRWYCWCNSTWNIEQGRCARTSLRYWWGLGRYKGKFHITLIYIFSNTFIIYIYL